MYQPSIWGPDTHLPSSFVIYESFPVSDQISDYTNQQQNGKVSTVLRYIVCTIYTLVVVDRVRMFLMLYWDTPVRPNILQTPNGHILQNSPYASESVLTIIYVLYTYTIYWMHFLTVSVLRSCTGCMCEPLRPSVYFFITVSRLDSERNHAVEILLPFS